MRKITEKAAKAFWNGERFTEGNTAVSTTVPFPVEGYENDKISLLLHGNLIAKWCKEENRLELSLCGWGTPTTRERLDGILIIGAEHYPALHHFGLFYQKNGFQYFNGNMIDVYETVRIDLTDYS